MNLSEIIRVAYYKIGMIENFIVVLTMLPFHFFEQSKTISLLFDISPDFFLPCRCYVSFEYCKHEKE